MKRLMLLAIGALFCAGCGEETTDWNHADNEVGSEVKVCGPIVSVIEDEDATFINVGLDYPDEDRFTLVFFDSGPDFHEDMEPDPEGWQVCGEGLVKRHEGVTQIIDPTVTFPEIEANYEQCNNSYPGGC